MTDRQVSGCIFNDVRMDIIWTFSGVKGELQGLTAKHCGDIVGGCSATSGRGLGRRAAGSPEHGNSSQHQGVTHHANDQSILSTRGSYERLSGDVWPGFQLPEARYAKCFRNRVGGNQK